METSYSSQEVLGRLRSLYKSQMVVQKSLLPSLSGLIKLLAVKSSECAQGFDVLDCEVNFYSVGLDICA